MCFVRPQASTREADSLGIDTSCTAASASCSVSSHFCASIDFKHGMRTAHPEAWFSSQAIQHRCPALQDKGHSKESICLTGAVVQADCAAAAGQEW